MAKIMYKTLFVQGSHTRDNQAGVGVLPEALSCCGHLGNRCLPRMST
jgi:hypothetical protein